MDEYNFNQAQQPDATITDINISETIRKMNSDMNFVGIFTIIYGVLNCLTIIGAVIGVPLIFAGMRLRDASLEFERYLQTNDVTAIYSGFEKQRRAFFIQKVLIIISIIFIILYVVFIIFMIGSMRLDNIFNNFQ